MDFVFTFALVSLVILIACIITYRYYTNSIIKDQERQIAELRTENFRLQAKLAGRQRFQRIESGPQVIEIHDDRIDPENIPTFGE